MARFGCPFAVTPLISAEALARGRPETRPLLKTGAGDANVVAAQIFGVRADAMAEAALAAAAVFPVVDLNCGCSVPKILKQGAGAALLDNLDALRKIVRAVVKISPVPVTAKLRLGVRTAGAGLAAAKMLFEEGVSAFAVHGRVAAQRLSGAIDVAGIRAIVNAVPAPVWANGDVRTPQDARELMEATGAVGVLVGRAAVPAPWLIYHVVSSLETGVTPPPPAPADVAAAILKHFRKIIEYDEETHAAKEFRKHLLAYVKGMRGSKELRVEATRILSEKDVEAVVAALTADQAYG